MNNFMPATWVLFAIVGPAFLVLGLMRAMSAGKLVPQSTVWFIVGTVFSGVALWLRMALEP